MASHASSSGDQDKVFGNHGITASIHTRNGHLSIDSIEDAATHASVHPRDAFVLMLQDGREIPSSAMVVKGALVISKLSKDAGASRTAGRQAGLQICADLLLRVPVQK